METNYIKNASQKYDSFEHHNQKKWNMYENDMELWVSIYAEASEIVYFIEKKNDNDLI